MVVGVIVIIGEGGIFVNAAGEAAKMVMMMVMEDERIRQQSIRQYGLSAGGWGEAGEVVDVLQRE